MIWEVGQYGGGGERVSRSWHHCDGLLLMCKLTLLMGFYGTEVN